MLVNYEDLSPVKKAVEVEIPADRISTEAQRVTTEFSRHAKLPGFRPGKVPANVVRTRFAKEIQEEVMSRLLPLSFREAIADKMMMIAGYLFYTLAPLAERIPPWLTFTIFVRDFFIVVFAYLLYTRVKVTRFPPSLAGKASTVLQAFTLATAIAVNGLTPSLRWLAEFLFRAALLITLFSAADYIRRAERMLHEKLLESAPGDRNSSAAVTS